MAKNRGQPRTMPPEGASPSTILGSRIGTYEIRALLGVGGMGEVYRARDSKLGREVAVKILPQMFTNDAGRLARFEREAQLLATLNHPNIAHIYGLEDAPADAGHSTHAIVMELVEGETLAERLQRTASAAESVPSRHSASARLGLPVEEALAIASQVASALDAAHEKGIIHRDLKPANIKIAPDGMVKVLDFGLAKRIETSGGDLATTVAGMQDGTLLGTVGYMSPEQARAVPVDKRTDVWAFGCVLYEMLTGRAVFTRDTVTDTLAAIVQQEPAWDSLPASIPSRIRQMLQRIITGCLEKDRDRRYGSMREVTREFVGVRQALDAVSRRRIPALAWAAVAFVAVAAVGAAAGWLLYQGRESRRAERALSDALLLADRDDYGGALALVEQAAHIVPSDARVEKLRDRVSVSR